MKTTILAASIILAISSATAQGLSRIQTRLHLLEPLLPFSEAVEKAKSGNAQGWYSLAIHYAKGEEIDGDSEKACQFMQKASDMNYSNAVFVATMLLEADCAIPSDGHRVCAVDRKMPYTYGYVGVTFPTKRQPTHSITNATDIANIRAGYERAFSLGVFAATNELARFESRVSFYQDKTKKMDDEKKRKEENAKLAEGLLIDSAPPKKQ